MGRSTQLVGLAAVLLTACVTFIAAPASADEMTTSSASTSAVAATPSFEIFYGPGCSSASRVYTGTNRGEAWVNDTFNRTTHGIAGSGQKIRNNAASIITHNVQSVNIRGNDGVYIAFSTQGKCVSLDSPFGNRRNNNTGWQTVPLGGF
ncbi:hypothetical protein ACEN85_08115 [Curtobacterium sp. CT11-45]|uniref:hypothetical protein n=1 Tax=Curtobacterium sp. CT11-45 TaxID=3243037 RepID=UPI0039AFC2FE